jgi:hypothetical protein
MFIDKYLRRCGSDLSPDPTTLAKEESSRLAGLFSESTKTAHPEDP